MLAGGTKSQRTVLILTFAKMGKGLLSTVHEYRFKVGEGGKRTDARTLPLYERMSIDAKIGNKWRLLLPFIIF